MKRNKPNTQGVNRMNPMNVLGKVLPNGTVYEEVYSPETGIAQFLETKPGAGVEKVDQFTYAQQDYRPLKDSNVVRGKVILPTDYKLGQDRKRLLEDVQAAIHKYVEVEPGFEAIMARYVIMTSVYDCFEKVPYLRIMGPYGSGKSRLLDVMASLCYHASKIGEGFTPAIIYRWLEDYPGTLIMDEADFGNTETSGLITQVMNGGNKRDGGVPRCMGNNYKRRFYNSFGPKVVACRRPYDDDALESRFLTCISQIRTRSDIPTSIPPFDRWKEMIDLRNRLLGFRLENLSHIDTEMKFDGYNKYEPRLAGLLFPLFQTTGETHIPSEIMEYIDEQNEDRFVKLGLGEEGIVAQALYNLCSNGRTKPALVKQITDAANEQRRNQYPLNYNQVGKIIKGLGFHTKRTGDGYRVVATPEKLKQLANRYGYSWSGD